ncbi:hypothetical protein BBJ28_00020080 [Nothophytophthora sp. Chile5]|nr:hypothetical protein BBJ28_00020080 [Nothophytophthora sp. Chile5]
MEANLGDHDLRFAALASLPTPVSTEECFRMWIPGGQLTADHNIDEILRSLASDPQPEVWKQAQPHLRDFIRAPNQGISFMCTSQSTCHALGDVQLKICGIKATIRKFSLYDKWYFVDLVRLPAGVPDRDIYDWFVGHDARPVLITPTYVAGGLGSRGRTVYFPCVECPPGLFTESGDAVREIFFSDEEKPCFVQHRNRKLNRVKPPSARAPRAPPSEVSDDASMGSSETSTPAPDLALSTRNKKTVILGSVSATTDPEWKLVRHSQHGVLNYSAIPAEPTGAIPCELTEDANDPTALVYSMPVKPNYYEVLVTEAYDESTPPDLDVSAVEDGEEVSGFTSDTPLLPLPEVRALKQARQLSQKVSQLSVAELDSIIHGYIERDVMSFSAHEDVLAAIQVQPAYLRRIFWLSEEFQTRLFRAHAVYRAVCAEPVQIDEPADFSSRMRARFGDRAADPALLFDEVFVTDETRLAAIHCARCDLFLMIFAPGPYIDPVKIQAMLPPTLPPKRLRNTPFLLWGDVSLLCLARTDLVKIFIDDERTPGHITASLSHLSSIPLPSAVETAPTRLVQPQL